MKRQILIGIVLVGNSVILLSDLSEDQKEGLLNEDYAETVTKRDGINDTPIQLVKLTEKGRKTYQALEAVVGIGTQW